MIRTWLAGALVAATVSVIPGTPGHADPGGNPCEFTSGSLTH
jgi:hypothetical protein